MALRGNIYKGYRAGSLNGFGFAFDNIDNRRKHHDVFSDGQHKKIFFGRASKRHESQRERVDN
jgi:hypothetical protein